MLIKTIPVGQLETNCYVVTNENTLESVVIDPGDEANTILDYLESNHLKCVAILLTHGHFDHVGALRAVQEETGAAAYMNRRDDARFSTDEHMRLILEKDDRTYDEGDVVEAAGLRFYVMATPGHTPGGVTLRCEDALFTGDTLFDAGGGRTDLPGGSDEMMMNSLNRLIPLARTMPIHAGH